jgi:hypothetical protein
MSSIALHNRTKKPIATTWNCLMPKPNGNWFQPRVDLVVFTTKYKIKGSKNKILSREENYITLDLFLFFKFLLRTHTHTHR